MKKRILSGLLCAALLLALAPAAQAKAEDVPEREKAVVLRELDILVGDPTGALHLERDVTRAEFTKLLVAASPYRDSVGATAATDPYPDVSHRAWYAPYVRVAVDAGLVKGDLAGLFHPKRTITLAEGATMVVRLLGYSDDELPGPWPTGHMALYRSLKLGAGVSAQAQGDLLTRRDCLHLFYNLLTVSHKNGTPYINLLGHTLNQAQEVDVSALFQVEQEGPIPLAGDYQSLLPFDLDDALIYRDGERVQLSELREWDVLYWAKDQPILFASAPQQGSNSQPGSMAQVSAAVEGPVAVEGDWQSKLPFPLSQVVSVTRNGQTSSLSALRPRDLVYWSKYARTLYVYGKTASGTVESINPSLASPTSVTVASQNYSLETFEAQYAFSDMGSFRQGDAVTLLLGRGGGVAAVRAMGEEDAAVQVGVLTAIGSTSYEDADGGSYSADTVTLTATDGKRYTYPWSDDSLEVGDLAQVTLTAGTASVRRLSRASLAGAVSAGADRLGELPLSPDVEILDTFGKTGLATVYPSRLAGVTLTESMVRYYTLDDTGAVNALILDDVTGDSHSYGILTDRQNLEASLDGLGLVSQTSYTYDVNGQERVAAVTGKQFSVRNGPVVVKTDGQQVSQIKNLTALPRATLSGRSVTASGRRYTLADNALFYLYDPASEKYTASNRTRLLSGGYTLTAYCDAPDAAGGRVRILVGSPAR